MALSFRGPDAAPLTLRVNGARVEVLVEARRGVRTWSWI